MVRSNGDALTVSIGVPKASLATRRAMTTRSLPRPVENKKKHRSFLGTAFHTYAWVISFFAKFPSTYTHARFSATAPKSPDKRTLASCCVGRSDWTRCPAYDIVDTFRRRRARPRSPPTKPLSSVLLCRLPGGQPVALPTPCRLNHFGLGRAPPLTGRLTRATRS